MSASTGAAALLGCAALFTIWQCCVFTLGVQGFLYAQCGDYYCPWCALRVAGTLGARLSKRLICCFLRSSEHCLFFLRICRYSCQQIRLQTLLLYGTLSPVNWNLQRYPYSYNTGITYKDGVETTGTLTGANEGEYNVHMPDGNRQVTFYYVRNMVNVIKIPYTEASRAECA